MTTELFEKEKRVYHLNFFIRFYPLIVKKAKDYRIWDENEKEYIDFSSSWSVANLGYNHPKIKKAFLDVYNDISALSLTTFAHRKPLELAELLIKITPGNFKKRVIFGFSGSDANDALYKLFSLRGENRFRIISFTGSYHGQTLGSLLLSGHPSLNKITINISGNVIKAPYPYCYRCPFGESYPNCSLSCLEYLEKQILQIIAPKETVAGMIIEPFQSDGGDIPMPPEFANGMKKIQESYNIWIASDEVKVGLGRTGKMFAIEHYGIEPDAITLGKPLGSGMPISALIAREEAFKESFSHLFTLAGHPAIASLAIETIRTILEENLIERARILGDKLLKRLEEIKEKHRLIGDVRGKGLIAGIELVKDERTKEPARKETAKVVYRLWQLGLITTYVGIHSNVIELTPPLIIEEDALDKAVELIDEAIGDVEKGKVSDSEIKDFAGW